MDEETEPLSRDWPTIRDAYEHGGETIAQICDRFGVTKGALEYRQRQDGWAQRSGRDASSRSLLLGRMFKVLDKQVQRLEAKDMTEQGEKEAALLGIAVKTMEKLIVLDRDERGNAPKQKKDMRDLRDKLAKRLDQLKQR